MRAVLLLLSLAFLNACDGDPSGLSQEQRSEDLNIEPLSHDASLEEDQGASRLLHVSPGADEDEATGSRFQPFPDPAQAYQQARPGDVIFLLPGEYSALAPPPGVELMGSGEESRLRGDLELEEGSISNLSFIESRLTIKGEVSLRDLRLEQSSLNLKPEARADLERVSFYAAPDPALESEGALSWRGGGIFEGAGVGCLLNGEPESLLQDLRFEDLGGPAVRASAGSVSLEKIRIDRVLSLGLDLQGVEAQLKDLQIAQVEELEFLSAGISALGGRLEGEEIQIDEALKGLRIREGAEVSLSALEINAVETGINIDEARLTLEGLKLIGARSTGIVLNDGALTLRGAQIQGAVRVGLLSDGGSLELEDLEISAAPGRGMSLLRSQGELSAVSIQNLEDLGAQITDPTGLIHWNGGEISGVVGAGVALFGRGEQAIELEGLKISQVRLDFEGLGPGLQLYQTWAKLSDLEVQQCQGQGVYAELSELEVQGGLFRGNGAPGIALLEPSTLSLIQDVRSLENLGAGFLLVSGEAQFLGCEALRNRASPVEGPGDGLAVPFQGTIQVEGGRYSENRGSGISLSLGSGGHITGAQIQENGGYGIEESCNGPLELSELEFEGNRRGDRSGCF